MLVNNENRTRVRITNGCNSKCKFCLEGEHLDRSKDISKGIIKEKIASGIKEGFFNKIIISGGEASTNPDLPEYIAYAKECGYEKIQTITNGIMWHDLEFCRKCVESGLHEITFSIHGHNAAVHDYLTGIPGSFNKLLKGILNFKKYFPHIILNSDVVINKYNIESVHKIIKLLKKIGVFEYDMLQIIPFGSARKNEKLLFEDVYKYQTSFTKIWEEGIDPRVHMRANRVFPNLLEGYERFIQTPEKIEDEVANEGKENNERAFDSRVPFDCKSEINCKNCYQQDFCSQMESWFKLDGGVGLSRDEIGYKLWSYRAIDKVDEKYPIDFSDFKSLLISESDKFEYTINIPFCLVNKNNHFTNFNDFEGEKTFINYVHWYEDEGFRLKAKSCYNCKFNTECKGLHVNLIKKYGFKVLSPINRL